MFPQQKFATDFYLIRFNYAISHFCVAHNCAIGHIISMKKKIWIAILLSFFAIVHISIAEQLKIDDNLVVLVADPHVFPGTIKRAKGFERETLSPFTNMVHQVTTMNPRPAALLFLGDLVEQPKIEAYQLLKRLLSPVNKAKIPCYFILGNHDQAATFYKVFPEWKKKTSETGTLAYRISSASHGLSDAGNYRCYKPRRLFRACLS